MPASCSQLPISQEPVKETAFSGLALTSASPSSPPEPATKLTTPLGMPASWQASTIRHALSGETEAGFMITVLPQISAGASFHAGIALGKFHGVTRPTTPSGLRNANMWTRSRSLGTSMPIMREPSPREVTEDLMLRRTSPLASGSVLPSSRVMSAADLVELASRMSATLNRKLPARRSRHAGPGRKRCLRRLPRQPPYPPREPLTNRPTTSSVLAGLRFSNVEPPVTHSPLM